MAEIREAVKILVARFKTNPEDFQYGGRFSWVVDIVRGVYPVGSGFEALTDEEQGAIKAAAKAFLYDEFHSRVLELADRLSY